MAVSRYINDTGHFKPGSCFAFQSAHPNLGKLALIFETSTTASKELLAFDLGLINEENLKSQNQGVRYIYIYIYIKAIKLN